MKIKFKKTDKRSFHRWFAWLPVKADVIRFRPNPPKETFVFAGLWVWMEFVERRSIVAERGKRKYEYRTENTVKYGPSGEQIL